MKKILILVAVVVAVSIVVIASTKSGYSQKTDIKGVVSIEVNIACQLILVQGNSPNLEIMGDNQAVDNVKIKINGDKLTLSTKHDLKWQRKDDIVVKIEVENIQSLEIGGAVDMKTVRTLKLDNLKMSVSGVGNIEMALECKSFRLNGSGVTNLDITGKTDELNMSISGVGNIRATEFIAKKAKVSNSGVGKANVHVTDNLDAEVSGIGSIYYTGTPNVYASVSGLGKIRRE